MGLRREMDRDDGEVTAGGCVGRAGMAKTAGFDHPQGVAASRRTQLASVYAVRIDKEFRIRFNIDRYEIIT